MHRRIPPLNSLRAFEVLGRRGKLADAADELCVTISAVSRHIAIVEEFVGMKLFERHSRGFTLTTKGEKYLQSVGHVFDHLDMATTQLIGQKDQHPLSVRVFTTFASEWLVPRLPAFMDAHPEIDLRLSSAVTSDDIQRVDADIFISRGPFGADMDADLLYYPEYFPVCSPAFLARGPGLFSAQDLGRCILLSTAAQTVNWNAWLAYAGGHDVDLDRALMFDNASLAFRAAREGVGVALAQRYYLVDDFLAGRLVSPFLQGLKSRNAFYMVFPRHRADEPHVRAFRQWLLGLLNETKAHSALMQNMPLEFCEVH